MARIPKENFALETLTILRCATGSDYAGKLVSCPEFTNAVREDVELSSAWEAEGYYNTDDIRLAIGRVLCEKYGLED